MCTESGEGESTPVINLGDFDGRLAIASLGFPSPYVDNSDCHWAFEASDPHLMIEVEVLAWNVIKTNNIKSQLLNALVIINYLCTPRLRRVAIF